MSTKIDGFEQKTCTIIAHKTTLIIQRLHNIAIKNEKKKTKKKKYIYI